MVVMVIMANMVCMAIIVIMAIMVNMVIVPSIPGRVQHYKSSSITLVSIRLSGLLHLSRPKGGSSLSSAWPCPADGKHT